MNDNRQQPVVSAPGAPRADGTPKWLNRFQSISPWSMVAFARAFMTLFALLSVYVDPTQPSHNVELTYSLLGAYMAYAIVMAGTAVRIPLGKPIALVSHCVDVLFFSLLIYLTDGPTSPFFVYFTFVLFSGTMRWSWRGALATTAATVGIFLAIVLFSDAALVEHPGRTAIRVAYLLAAGLLFAYFGAVIERARIRLARLAAWPASTVSTTDDPALESTLAHAASVMNVPRLLVVWEYFAEPFLHSAEFRDRTTHFEITRGILSGFLEGGGRAKRVTLNDELPGPLRTWLAEKKIRHAIMAPIAGSTLKGAVFFICDNRPGKDLLPLANIAIMRITAEIEQHNLRLRLIRAAATEERARLARDIHDDLLQGLAAVSLQLKTLEPQLPDDQEKRLASVRALLSDQQRKLRQLVDDARDRQRRAPTFAVAKEISEMLETAEAQWQCTTSFVVEPPNLIVGQHDGKALSLLTAEAIANGVRHGKASDFRIGIEAESNVLTLRIEDNGTGAPSLAGTFDHDAVIEEELGSASLRDRVKDLGWRIELSSSPQGMAITIKAPMG